MNNVFVYCELEGTVVAEVSLELLTKGRKLANQLGCQLEAVVAGTNLRRSGLVPLYFTAPLFRTYQSVQGRKTADLSDGRHSYRS